MISSLAPVAAIIGLTGSTAIGDSFCLFFGNGVVPIVPGLTLVTVTDVAWLSPVAIRTMASDAAKTIETRAIGCLRMHPSRSDRRPAPCRPTGPNSDTTWRTSTQHPQV